MSEEPDETGGEAQPDPEEASEVAMPMSIYVLPTEENVPPTAILIMGMALTPDGLVPMGEAVTWSQDMGTWMREEGTPVDADLGKAITEHAKELGVQAFL
jgi:hypothetical protein